MIKILYVILIIGLPALSILIRRKIIEKKFFKKNILPTSLYLDRRFLIALFFPQDYFKKEKFWQGYLLYIFSVILFIISIYLFIKFIGVL